MLGGEQDPFAEQRQPGPAEHLSLDHFDVVDAAFDGSGVPAAGQALGDGVEVLFEAFGEGRYAGQSGGPGAADPLREVLAGELGEHRGEGADMGGGGLEFGAAFQQGLELGLLVFGQGIRMAGEPAGDFPDARWRRRERRCGGAVLVKVVTDSGVAAVIAECADLPEQLGDVAAAFRRALVQMGLEGVEQAGARRLPAAIDEFLPGGGACVALDGVPSPAQVAGDGPHAVPLGQQFVHHRVVPAGSLGELPGRLRLWLWRGRRLCGRPGSGVAAGPGSGSPRQARCAATDRSTALARFCHRWNRSATWIASGAPVRAPSA